MSARGPRWLVPVSLLGVVATGVDSSEDFAAAAGVESWSATVSMESSELNCFRTVWPGEG